MAFSGPPPLMTEEEVLNEFTNYGYQKIENTQQIDLGLYKVQPIMKGDDVKLALLSYSKSRLPTNYRQVMFNDDIKSFPSVNFKYLSEVLNVWESPTSFSIVCRWVRHPKVNLAKERSNWDNGRIPIEITKEWFRCIAIALQVLHSNGYAHRNINETNILIKSRKSAVLMGYSLRKDEQSTVEMENTGNILFPPQVEPVDHFKDDIWCLANVMFRLIRSDREFVNYYHSLINNEEVLLIGSDGDLLSKMLKLNPSERITAEEVINHNYFKRKDSFDSEVLLNEPADEYKLVKNVESSLFSKLPDKIRKEIRSGGVKSLNYLTEGGYSSLFKVELVEPLISEHPNDKFAVMKVINLSHYAVGMYEREIDLVKNVHHRNIVKFIALFSEIPRHVYVVMELAKEDLYQVIQRNGTITKDNYNRHERFMKPIIKGFITGLAHLHEIGWSHRDMKPLNVLIKLNGEACICDFTLSQKATAETVETREFGGTAFWSSPQLLYKEPYRPICDDIWAAGVTIYNCLTGHITLVPIIPGYDKFPRFVLERIFESRTNTVRSSVMSNDAKTLVSSMLCYQELDRIKLNVALKWSFFRFI